MQMLNKENYIIKTFPLTNRNSVFRPVRKSQKDLPMSEEVSRCIRLFMFCCFLAFSQLDEEEEGGLKLCFVPVS